MPDQLKLPLPSQEGDPPSLGDRVIWRSGSHNFAAEKIGTVIFLGPKGWQPEHAPIRLKHWLDKEWKEAIRNRRPERFEDLVRRFPDPDGRGQSRAWREHRRMTSRARYKFEKCTSGIVVAVREYRQLTFDTKQETITKPKRPTFYAPRIKARKGHSGVVVWPEGQPRPVFPVEPIGLWEFDVRYVYKERNLEVRKKDGSMFEGRGTNQAAAQRHCLATAAKETRHSRECFAIHTPGIPMNDDAKKIDGKA